MKRNLGRHVAGAVLALMLAACGGSDDPPRSASAVIGAAGGTLTGPDGVQIAVPPGALAQATELTIARLDSGAPARPDGYEATTPTYEFTPHGLAFAQPVTIRMPYTPPAGADDAGVFMSNPGEPWAPMQATVAGGVAEWQRSTLSFGVGLGCVIQGQSQDDPYRCTWAQMGVPVVATPGSGMVSSPFHPGTVHTVNAEVALRFTMNYSAARDCASPRVRVIRAGDGVGNYLLDQPVSLTPSPTNSRRSIGTSVFDITLGHADNGYRTLAFFFFCSRPGDRRQSASVHHFFNVAVPVAPATTAPAVLTQPIDQSVTAPATATFTAAASGSPAPTWQWQRSTDGGANWTNIAGATGASYTTAATTVADDGLRLRAVATNSAGTVTTAAVLLTVRAAVTGPSPFLGRWPVPTTIALQNNTVGGLIREPQIACGRSGACVAAWARISSNDPINDGVYVSRYVTGQGWSAPTQFASDRGREPRVGIDDNGNAVVVWSARDGGDIPQAYVRRFTPASGWGNVEQMSPAGTDRAQMPMAVAMRQGQVAVAYVRRIDSEGPISLWVARPTANGWASVRVPNAGAAFNGLRAALDADNRVTVSWRGASNAAMAATGEANGTWSAAVDLSGPRLSSRAPRLGLDSDGQAFVAWQEDAATASLHVRRRPAGAGWEPVQSLNFAAGITVDEMDMAVGSAGTATVVYVREAGDIVTRNFSAASGWGSTETLVMAATTLESDLPSITMDTGGNTTVLWRGYDGSSFAIYTRSFAPGLGWAPALASAPVRLATIEQSYRDSELASTGDGRAAVLIVRTDFNILDELLGAVQIP